jgi:general secretion pathway protein D
MSNTIKIALALGLFFPISLLGQEKIKFYFNNEEIAKVLETFSRASGQKMIVDPGVKGKISIFNPDSVDLTEALNQVSKALAINSFGIVREGETLIVRPVRQIQRGLLEVGSELPAPNPERLFSWVVTLKNIPISVVSKDLRILLSKDGEMSTLKDNNQIIFVDWLSNLYRVRELLKQIDIPKDPEVEKKIAEYLKSQKSKN